MTLADTGLRPAAEARAPVVCAYNEWDPLEEVIVGVLDGACAPTWHMMLETTMPEDQWSFYRQHGGQPFPKEQIEAANKDLAEFVHLLEAEGVTVRRPEAIDFCQPYATPDWTSAGGLYAAMPRDGLLVIGEEIIETPMAWRSRYFEAYAFRPLIREYFRRGAKWTAAPKPELKDAFYNHRYREGSHGHPWSYAITELEPTFDAADCIRCGRDIFIQKSHVTNDFGIDWLQRHLGDAYRVHRLTFNDDHPMHIDATFMPLAPGKLLINPERVVQAPPMFKTWDVRPAPPPCIPVDHTLYMTSRWISMNLLMLDEERVMVERQEEPLIEMLTAWGFKPIRCNFQNFNRFGGSFHCATLDVRRRGDLQSYF